MGKLITALKSNLFTGFVVLLPISLLVLVVVWLYGFIAKQVRPLADLFGPSGLWTTILALILLLFVIFLVGLLVRTRLGKWFFTNLERYIFSYLPGYKTIKSITEPFLGSNYQDSFKRAVLVDIYDNGTLMTGFVTDTHKEPYTTVFVPTGPNPTSGNIYHVPNKRVHLVDVPMDIVLSSVVACGNGSQAVLKKKK